MIQIENMEIGAAQDLLHMPLPDTEEVWAVIVDGELAVVAGISRSSLCGWPDLWMTPFPAFYTKYRQIVKNGRALMDFVRSKYPNFVMHVTNEKNARYARAFGYYPADTEIVQGITWTRCEARRNG